MRRLSSIMIENFRAFADPAQLSLRNLTLIYGRNGVGKSTLARLPGIIGDSIAESARAPFDLAGDAGGDATFLDVLSDPSIRKCPLTLRWSDGLVAHWVLYWEDESKLIRVGYLRIEGDGTSFIYKDPRAAVVLNSDEAATTDSLTFDGLIPHVFYHPLVEQLRQALFGLRGRIQWLGAVRARPPIPTPERGSRLTRLRSDGRDAFEVLLSDVSARAEVTTWFASTVKRELRSEEVQPRQHRWLLPPSGGFNRSIGLLESGEGWLQVVPVLTALAMRSRPPKDGLKLIAMEEPTTHLHDDAQIAIAEHLAHLASEDDPVTIVCETHARPLLLGVQLAVAKGLDPSRVGLHWVHQEPDGRSNVHLVELDRQGLPLDDTLQHAFTEELDLLKQLARVQQRRPDQTK